MRRALLFLLAIAVVLAAATADPARKRKAKKQDGFSFAAAAKVPLEERKAKSADEDGANDLEQQQQIDSSEDLADLVQPDGTTTVKDLCRDLKCGPGRECRVDDSTGVAKCHCVEECGYEVDPRRQVCSNHNETFNTDCDLYRSRCLCEDGDDRCTEPGKAKHVHIEYYGECRSIPDCSDDELTDFPRRMREWLFNVMQELAERHELSGHYAQMEEQAEKDQSKRWRNAAVWKWCDLDGHPVDNVVSRHELFPVRAPLQTLEHCIGDFLDGCDADDDHAISLKEWGACLELEESELIAECEKLEMN
jgi:hypothetical protein